jgi:hypothetical protein
MDNALKQKLAEWLKWPCEESGFYPSSEGDPESDRWLSWDAFLPDEKYWQFRAVWNNLQWHQKNGIEAILKREFTTKEILKEEGLTKEFNFGDAIFNDLQSVLDATLKHVGIK